MDFDTIVTNIYNWQKQKDLWQDQYGKIDKAKAQNFEITNSPSTNQNTEFLVYIRTPLTRSLNGNMLLWEFINQYTHIHIGKIDIHAPNNQLVIVRRQNSQGSLV